MNLQDCLDIHHMQNASSPIPSSRKRANTDKICRKTLLKQNQATSPPEDLAAKIKDAP